MRESVKRVSAKSDDSAESKRVHETYSQIIQKVNEHTKVHRDHDDNSLHPSYTRFQLP